MKKARKIAMEVGAGVLTAAALAAASAYLLSNKKTRAQAKVWALKARREVAKNVRTARKMGEKEYVRLVDQATKRYGALHKITAPEVRKIAADLKSDWKRLRKDARVLSKMMKKGRPARKTAGRRAQK